MVVFGIYFDVCGKLMIPVESIISIIRNLFGRIDLLIVVVVLLGCARFVIVFVHQMIICVITCCDLMSIGWQDGSGYGGD